MPYVFGSTLYFNPTPAQPPVFAIKFTRNAAGELVSNVEGLRMERNLTVARDVFRHRAELAQPKKTDLFRDGPVAHERPGHKFLPIR